MPNLLWAIVVGLVAGWLAGQFMHGRGFGVIGNIVVGIVGALLGSVLFGFLGISFAGVIGEIIMATIGAVVVLFLVGLFRRGSAASV